MPWVFLHNRIDIKACKRKILMLWVLDLIGIMASCVMTYDKATATGVFDEGHSQAFQGYNEHRRRKKA